jgi:hypothetical protein
MSNSTKSVLWVLGTVLVALLAQLGVDLANPEAELRFIIAHAMTAVATSVGALLVKLPPKDWDGDERREV